MALVYLSLGSNLGRREGYLESARRALREAFGDVRFSRVYETEPVDLPDQPWFLNQVAEFRTQWLPRTLLSWTQAREGEAGRERGVPKGPRTLDLDLLLYDDLVMDSQGLVLPHPGLERRRHVLTPLAELAAERKLPPGGRTVREALAALADPARVGLYGPDPPAGGGGPPGPQQDKGIHVPT
jgi:2-amino-4-hydroxy-6-hydroxymethyldihydropteridine diphosphokinase